VDEIYRGRERKRERDGKRMAFWFSVRSHLLASNHPHPLSHPQHRLLEKENFLNP
jgi:hypothetical protein